MLKSIKEKKNLKIRKTVINQFLKIGPPGPVGGVPMGPRASKDPWASRTPGSQGLGLRGPMGLKDPGPMGLKDPIHGYPWIC